MFKFRSRSKQFNKMDIVDICRAMGFKAGDSDSVDHLKAILTHRFNNPIPFEGTTAKLDNGGNIRVDALTFDAQVAEINNDPEAV